MSGGPGRPRGRLVLLQAKNPERRRELAAGGPAELAGVLPGDILLAFDGVPVARPRGLAALLDAERIGRETELRLMRAGAVRTVRLAPASRPAA